MVLNATSIIDRSEEIDREGDKRLPELRRVASAIALTSSEASLMERRLASSILAEFRAAAAAASPERESILKRGY